MTPEAVQANSRTTMEPISSPRISFSGDFLDETNFISINPHSRKEEKEPEKEEMMKERVLKARGAAEFEFLSTNIVSGGRAMLAADELFFEGKLLPFRQMQQRPERLNKISLRTKDAMEDEDEKVVNKEDSKVNRFVDDDPSPRPPKCTVLWKELLRLKKQRASSSLSPSSSSSSSSTSLPPDIKLRNGCKQGSKHAKRIKIRKGL